MRADGEGDDYVVVNHEQDAVAVGHPEVEDLMAVPSDAFEFVAAERGMPPMELNKANLARAMCWISDGRALNSRLNRTARRKITGL